MWTMSRKGVSSAVLYHYPCADGVFAALAAHLYHQAVGQVVNFFPNTVYRPLRLDELCVDEFEVFYLLDFVGPDDFALDLCKKAKQVVVLDHHKTALTRMPSAGQGPKNLHAVLDMNRSGATIAYDYFQGLLREKKVDIPKFAVFTGKEMVPIQDKQRVEKMFKFVEDGDLWRWQLPDSKAFMGGLKDFALEYNAKVNPSIFNQLLELDIDEVLAKGREGLSEKQAAIDSALEKSFELQIGGGKFGRFLGVRADLLQELRSDLGHQLAEKSLAAGLRPIAAVVYEVPELGDDSMLKVSLRSIDDDTTEVSQAYGGGGHRCASSFMIKKTEFEQWV